VFCKSMNSLIYGALLLPMVAVAAPKRAPAVAFVLALVVLIYPVLRFLDWLPMEQLGGAFTSLSPERADSLLYRVRM